MTEPADITDAAVAPPSRLRGLVVTITRKGGWPITDQAIASIGNFGRDVLLAKYVAADVLGAYSLVLPVFFFLASLQAALVIYPVQVRGAVVDPERLPRFATASLILTLLLSVPLLLAMGISTIVAIRAAPLGLGSTVAAVMGLLFTFQLQELSRRTLMARLRFAAAVPGDTIVYIGQLGLLAAFGEMGWMSGPRGLAVALGSMSVLTVIAALVQAAQIGFARISMADLRSTAVEFWHLGKWIAAANFTTIVTDIGYRWVLGKGHALDIAGNYHVITSLNKLTNPVVMTLVGLIVPVVAKTRGGSNVGFAKRVGLKYAGLGFVAIASFLLIMMIVPELPLYIFYRDYMHVANGVRIFALTTLVGFCATMALAILNGLGRPQVQFWTQVTNTLASLGVGLPLTFYFGLWGALWGGLFATVALTLVALTLFHRTR